MAILGTAVGQKLQSLHVIERGSIPSILIPFQFSRNKFLLPKYTAYLKKKITKIWKPQLNWKHSMGLKDFPIKISVTNISKALNL